MLKKWILSVAENEEIEGIVLGEMDWDDDYESEEIQSYKKYPKNKLLSWEEALPFISYEFCSGYGAPGCQAITAWTKSKVIFVSQYDGSTRIEFVPRNPCDCEPEMPGG